MHRCRAKWHASLNSKRYTRKLRHRADIIVHKLEVPGFVPDVKASSMQCLRKWDVTRPAALAVCTSLLYSTPPKPIDVFECMFTHARPRSAALHCQADRETQTVPFTFMQVTFRKEITGPAEASPGTYPS
jgi:hypothetical protein